LIELDALQKEAGFFVGVFVGVEDVAAMAVESAMVATSPLASGQEIRRIAEFSIV